MKHLKLATAGVLAFTGFTGLLAPATASAALVTGNATFTIDNSVFKASNGYADWINKWWGPADNNTGITSSTPGGTTLPLSGNFSMLFPVNNNLVTTYCNACGPYGRSLQATTMDASNTSIGQIGLSGAWLVDNVSHTGTVTPYDFHLRKTAGTWNIVTYDTAFGYQNFLTLTNVSESLNGNGELLLSGDLKWTGLWASLAQANRDKVIGTFTLAPAAVPVPAAVWMFGSGLLGLLGVARRKALVVA